MTMDSARAFLFILSSPSGGGKTTMIRELRKRHPEWAYSISATTRPPRQDEKHGEDYWFLTESEFREGIRNGRFMEWAEVHGYLYGTPKEPIEIHYARGKKVLLDIDVKGALAVKKQRSDAVLIFLHPPSMDVLRQRLSERGTEDDPMINKRLAAAEEEKKYAERYDFQLINGLMENTLEDLESIITHYTHPSS
jgi:guanylate kinase